MTSEGSYRPGSEPTDGRGAQGDHRTPGELPPWNAFGTEDDGVAAPPSGVPDQHWASPRASGTGTPDPYAPPAGYGNPPATSPPASYPPGQHQTGPAWPTQSTGSPASGRATPGDQRVPPTQYPATPGRSAVYGAGRADAQPGRADAQPGPVSPAAGASDQAGYPRQRGERPAGGYAPPATASARVYGAAEPAPAPGAGRVLWPDPAARQPDQERPGQPDERPEGGAPGGPGYSQQPGYGQPPTPPGPPPSRPGGTTYGSPQQPPAPDRGQGWGPPPPGAPDPTNIIPTGPGNEPHQPGRPAPGQYGPAEPGLYGQGRGGPGQYGPAEPTRYGQPYDPNAAGPPPGQPTTAAAAKSGKGKLIVGIVLASVVILILAGIAYYLGVVKKTDDYKVGACVKQQGNQAVLVDCSTSGAYKIERKVADKADCDTTQPFIIVDNKNGSKTTYCLTPR